MQHVVKKSIWCGVPVLAIVLAICLWQMEPTTARADRVASPGSSGGTIISHVVQTTENSTQVIVLDPVFKRLAVYTVNSSSGEIQLKSVRNLQADLKLQEYNSADPSPLEIHKMQERN